MTTFRIAVQKSHERKDGTFPISIRVTHNRKIAYITTGKYATRQQLTKTYELKDPDILNVLSGRIKKYRDITLDIDDDIDVRRIVEILSSDNNGAPLDLFKYGLKIADGKGGEKNYKTTLANFSRLIGSDTMPISRVTSKMLRDFEASLSGSRSPSAYLACLRHIFKSAIKEYPGIIKINPFDNYDMPRQNVAPKRALTAEQIIRIRDYSPVGVRDELAHDAFMLSFYLLGMNSIDLYHCPAIKNGRIEYCRFKTKDRRDDRALISVRIEPEAMVFIEKFIDPDHNRAFRFYKMYSDAGTFNAAINKGLKVIGKTIGVPGLTYYYARHSWATIARNDCKVAKSDIHEALNHVDEEMRVTDLYIKKDWSRIDEANRAVLDYIKTINV